MECACELLGPFQPAVHSMHQRFSSQVVRVANQLNGWATTRLQSHTISVEQEQELLAESLAYQGELDQFAQDLIARSRAYLEIQAGASYSQDVAAIKKQLIGGADGRK